MPAHSDTGTPETTPHNQHPWPRPRSGLSSSKSAVSSPQNRVEKPGWARKVGMLTPDLSHPLTLLGLRGMPPEKDKM